MAARTCSRAVTQTARKGAHQGAARRQARKMLRQVSDPIKNNGASSKHCYAAQGRWLPCRIRPGIRGQRTAARQVRNIATKGKSDATACRSGWPKTEARNGSAWPPAGRFPPAACAFSPPAEGRVELTLPQTCGQASSHPLALPCAPASCPHCRLLKIPAQR